MKLSPRDWAARFKTGHWPAAILLHGADHGLISTAVDQLRRRLLGKDQEAQEFDFAKFYGADMASDQFLNDCRSLPLFVDKRLILVKEADRLSPEGRTTVLDYLKRANRSTVLLLAADALEAKHPLRKAFEADSSAWCVPFYPLAGEELRQWLRSMLATEGFMIETDALTFLQHRLEGGDTGLAEQELFKLRLFLGDERRISLDQVLAVVGEIAEFNGFALMESVSRGDGAQALRILASLLDAGEEPIALLGLLAQRLRRFAQALELLAQNTPEKSIVPRLQIFWKEEQQFFAICRQLEGSSSSARGQTGGRRLAEALLWCLDTDLALKGGGMIPANQALERLVIRLAAMFSHRG